ncbi:MAG: threonine/serine dehydratase [Thaumarchaeota archaeon]|nr:threonine/serine dehydratase [Nitrososphaerota archaeon]
MARSRPREGPSEPSLLDVIRAEREVSRYLTRTPLRHYPSLDKLLSAEVYVKHENFEPTGSFKVRGQLNVISNLGDAERKRGVIVASTGNDAQAAAFASGLLGVRCVVVMPENPNPLKAESTRLLGADLILHGRNFDEARLHAEALAREKGYHYIHSVNEPNLVAGAGTIGLEIVEELPSVDEIIVPIGGGALAAGICVSAKEMSPTVKVVGVQSDRSQAVFSSWKGGKIVEKPDRTTHEGLATGTGYDLTHRILAEHLDDFLILSDDEITKAMRLFIEKTRTLVEGAGAAPLAGALRAKSSIKGKRVVLVATGANVSMELLRKTIA